MQLQNSKIKFYEIQKKGFTIAGETDGTFKKDPIDGEIYQIRNVLWFPEAKNFGKRTGEQSRALEAEMDEDTKRAKEIQWYLTEVDYALTNIKNIFNGITYYIILVPGIENKLLNGVLSLSAFTDNWVTINLEPINHPSILTITDPDRRLDTFLTRVLHHFKFHHKNSVVEPETISPNAAWDMDNAR